jgi:DNA-binding MarR family transcriptional regulator
VQLVEAPERRLRMTELAQRVLISRSGLTRLVDRLEREGLVRREACDDDARGLFAVLTEAGFQRLRRASPTHLRGVASYAIDRLDDEQVEALAEICASCWTAARWCRLPETVRSSRSATPPDSAGLALGPALVGLEVLEHLAQL